MSATPTHPAAVSSLLSARRSGSYATLGVGLAIVLHLAVAVTALLLPRLLTTPTTPLEFVEVQVVPLAALGVDAPPPVREPPPQREAAPPPPPPPQEAKPPAPREEEAPPPVDSTAPTLPERREVPPPPPSRPPPPQPVTPQPVTPQPVTPQPQGSERGSVRGKAEFGAAVAALDNPDFTYSYYVDRMVALIRSQWSRPQAPEGTETVVRFRIQKNGSIGEVAIVESSSSRAFDDAAARAVRTAAPFPPLPAGYRHDSLGVTLNVR